MNRVKKMFVITIMFSIIIGFFAFSQPSDAAFGDRITTEGTHFLAGSDRIWINGTNAPYIGWDDFATGIDYQAWNDHFALLAQNGINAARVWMFSSGMYGINIDSSGYVSGATQQHWDNVDSLFQIAEQHGIYIMPTVMTHNNYLPENNQQIWMNFINSNSNIDSFINNYLVPFLSRYKDNPLLWSIDLFNEPDLTYEYEGVPWNRLQTYFAKGAAAIHQNSEVLVTVGLTTPKYMSTTNTGAEGNKISDADLQAQVNDPQAFVDFYSPHYYNWQDEWWGIPMYMTPTEFGIVHDRPIVIGETAAVGSGPTGSENSIIDDFFYAFDNGWEGVMPWKSTLSGSTGNLDDMAPATNAFRDAHYELVYPSSNGGSVTTVNDATLGTGDNQFEYVGTWNTSTGAEKYNGDDHYSSTTDAYYQVRFNGTKIKIYASKASHHGIAAVSIDGGTETDVDFYASTRTDNTLLWESPVLTDGAHTLKVRVKGTRNASSSGYVISADRVDISTETSDTEAPAIPTNLTATAVSNSQIDLSWTSSTDNVGVTGYDIFRDGVYIDTTTGTSYSSIGLNTSTTYSYAVKAKDAAGNVSAASNSESATTYAVITVNDATLGTGTNEFEYVGTWNTSTGAEKHNGDDHYSSTTDAYFQVDFKGTQIKIYASKASHHGIAAVSIDGGTETDVDFYASTRTDNTLLWESPVLTDGAHTLKVRVKGTNNASSSGYVVSADRVDIMEGSSEEPTAQYHFENGALHDFYGASGATPSNSTDRAYEGSSSMKMAVNVSSSTSAYVRLDAPPVSAGDSVTLRIWVPSGANIASIHPSVQDNDWTFSGDYMSYSNLTKGAWNTFVIQIPSNATSPFQRLSVQLTTSDSWNGSIYIDDISW